MPSLSTLCIVETHRKVVPPEFSKHLKSQDVPEGTQFVLESQVAGIPSPTISWYKDDENIDNSPDYVLTKINGTCCLKVRRAVPQHGARYTCKATNTGGEATSSAKLNVISKRLQCLGMTLYMCMSCACVYFICLYIYIQ